MDTPNSCYVLEFSVQPGGARLGDVHVRGSLAEIREAHDWRYLVEEHGVDGHLVLFYGAVLHLWAVEHGTVIAEVDLRRYLRTGDEAGDRVVERLLAGDAAKELGDIFEDVMWVNDHEPMRALAEFGQLFEWHDAGAVEEIQRMAERLKAQRTANRFTLTEDYPRLMLDWKAVEADLPALQGPMLTTGEVTIVWPDHLPLQPDSYLRSEFDADGAVELRAGLNDLEFGDNEFLA